MNLNEISSSSKNYCFLCTVNVNVGQDKLATANKSASSSSSSLPSENGEISTNLFRRILNLPATATPSPQRPPAGSAVCDQIQFCTTCFGQIAQIQKGLAELDRLQRVIGRQRLEIEKKLKDSSGCGRIWGQNCLDNDNNDNPSQNANNLFVSRNQLVRELKSRDVFATMESLRRGPKVKNGSDRGGGDRVAGKTEHQNQSAFPLSPTSETLPVPPPLLSATIETDQVGLETLTTAILNNEDDDNGQGQTKATTDHLEEDSQAQKQHCQPPEFSNGLALAVDESGSAEPSYQLQIFLVVPAESEAESQEQQQANGPTETETICGIPFQTFTPTLAPQSKSSRSHSNNESGPESGTAMTPSSSSSRHTHHGADTAATVAIKPENFGTDGDTGTEVLEESILPDDNFFEACTSVPAHNMQTINVRMGINGQMYRARAPSFGALPDSNDNKPLFKCDSCSYTCKYSGHLKVHVRRAHTGERPYVCHHLPCRRNFPDSSELKLHIRRFHTLEKPYVCPICSRTFLLKPNLNSHMTTHTGVKGFACNWCEMKFSFKSSLHRHMQRHTGEKRYECSICATRFRLRRTLNDHMSTHTGVRPFACQVPGCGQSYIQKRHLERHVEKQHSSTVTATTLTMNGFYGIKLDRDMDMVREDEDQAEVEDLVQFCL